MSPRVAPFRACCFAAFLAVAAGTAFADSPPPARSATAKSATIAPDALVPFDQTDCYATILNAEGFWRGTVGFPAPEPGAAHAVNGLLDRPDADEALKSLFAPTNSTVTRLWALTGLWFTDREAFDVGVAEMRQSSEEIQAMSGCLHPTVGVKELVWSDYPEVCVFDNPATAAEEFKKPRTSYLLDIAHGGIPAALRSLQSRRPTSCGPSVKYLEATKAPAPPRSPGIDSGIPYEQTDCYATLLGARSFSWELVGAAASVPGEAMALNALLDRADADTAMKVLFASTNSTPTRLWALTGLYFTDHFAFESGVRELRSSSELVDLRSGCEMDSTPVSEFVWSGSPEVANFPTPASAVEEFGKPRTGDMLDIAHGGIPAAIRSMKSRAQATCVPTSENAVIADQDRSAEAGR